MIAITAASIPHQCCFSHSRIIHHNTDLRRCSPHFLKIQTHSPNSNTINSIYLITHFVFFHRLIKAGNGRCRVWAHKPHIWIYLDFSSHRKCLRALEVLMELWDGPSHGIFKSCWAEHMFGVIWPEVARGLKEIAIYDIHFDNTLLLYTVVWEKFVRFLMISQYSLGMLWRNGCCLYILNGKLIGITLIKILDEVLYNLYS